jgi:membrane glycosyltransferase
VQCALARGERSGFRLKRLHVLRRRCLQDGPDCLNHKEITMLAKDRESLEWLHREAWRAPPGSFWAERILEWRRVSRGGQS